jgi:calcium-dependent protein kinase
MLSPLLFPFLKVLKGHIDFKSEPWPHVSEAAKDCVRKLLEMDPTKRADASAILRHEWLVKEGVALDTPLDHVVLKRMRQFAQMNRLKKMALMVVGQNLNLDELSGEGGPAEGRGGKGRARGTGLELLGVTIK